MAIFANFVRILLNFLLNLAKFSPNFFGIFPKCSHFLKFSENAAKSQISVKNEARWKIFWRGYVCISSRGPLPPLDLELYPRATQQKYDKLRAPVGARRSAWSWALRFPAEATVCASHPPPTGRARRSAWSLSWRLSADNTRRFIFHILF